MKRINVLGAVALVGVLSIGTAFAQSQAQAPQQRETPYQMLHGFDKHTSSAAVYKPTKLRPYDDSASPLS